jgi:hypothetical protein
MARVVSRGNEIENLSLLRDNAQDTACGPGDSYCRNAIDTNYETVFAMDKCSIQQEAIDDSRYLNRTMWLPSYQRKACEASGYVNCGSEVPRFGPRKVRQEALLQGRGQTTSSKDCPGSGLIYLPENAFVKDAEPTKAQDMSLFGQQTRLKKSCGSVSETDSIFRRALLPGAYQNVFSPIITDPNAQPPTIVSRLSGQKTGVSVYGSSRRKSEGHKLSDREKYPSWADLKDQQDRHMQG